MIYLIVFVCITLSAIAISTYLIGSEEKKKWFIYLLFSIICTALFSALKYNDFEFNTKLFYWKQPFMILTYHSTVILSIMAFLAIPKNFIKNFKENLVAIACVLSVSAVLIYIY